MKDYNSEYLNTERANRLALAQELIANLSEYGLTLIQLADKTNISLPSLKSFRRDPTAVGHQRWDRTELFVQLWGVLELEKKIGKKEVSLFSDYIDTVFDKAMMQLSEKEKGLLQTSKELLLSRPEALAELYYDYQDTLKRKEGKNQDQHIKTINYILNHSDEFSNEELKKISCAVNNRLYEYDVKN